MGEGRDIGMEANEMAAGQGGEGVVAELVNNLSWD